MDYTTDRVALLRRVDGSFAYGSRRPDLVEELLDRGGSVDDADAWLVFALVAYEGERITRLHQERLPDAVVVRGLTVHAVVVSTSGRGAGMSRDLARRAGGTLGTLATSTALGPPLPSPLAGDELPNCAAGIDT